MQAPTFTGDSGAGFAVTASGKLLRFDLDDPVAGAAVVFSSQRVLAAQALPDGKVVVAVGDGSVKILVPTRGGSLSVASELEPQGQTPDVPSAIQVVSQSSGQFDVLVSSQGSDTISVFAQGNSPSPSGPGNGSQGGDDSSAGGGKAVQITASAPGVAVSIVTGANSTNGARDDQQAASQTSVTAISSATTGTGTLSGNVSFTTVGLSLGSFSSGADGSSKGTTGAVLSAVEGNTYFSVPVLDFGAEGDDAGAGEGRMPWLATMHAIGDTSPLTRFVIGLDEAVRDYTGSRTEPGLEGEVSSNDPWSEDLFHKHNPLPSSKVESDAAGSMGFADPKGLRPSANVGPVQVVRRSRSQLIDECFEQSGLTLSSPAGRLAAGLQALAGALAAALLAPTVVGFGPIDPEVAPFLVRSRSKRERSSTAGVPAREANR